MWESVWFLWFRHAPIYHMLGRHMTAPNGWQFGTTIDSSWHSPLGLEIPCEVQNLPVGQAHVASHLDAWATDIVWYRPTEFRSSLFRPEIPAGQKDITKSKSNLSKSAPIVRPKVSLLPLFRSKNWRASRLSAWPAGYGCWPQGLSVNTTTETNEDAHNKTARLWAPWHLWEPWHLLSCILLSSIPNVIVITSEFLFHC